MNDNIIVIGILHKLLNDTQETLTLTNEKLDICMKGTRLYLDDLEKNDIESKNKSIGDGMTTDCLGKQISQQFVSYLRRLRKSGLIWR